MEINRSVIAIMLRPQTTSKFLDLARPPTLMILRGLEFLIILPSSNEMHRHSTQL